MCGIVALVSKQPSGFEYYADDLFTEMLKADTIRGPDSTGVFGVNKDGAIDVIKGNAEAYKFVQCKQYKDFEKKIFQEYRIVVGHNRKATFGTITANNAHPFKEQHIVLVHNGTLRNASELNKEVEVDSHAIAHALAEHSAKDALEKLDGAYAIVWFDQKEKLLCLARNVERPLYLMDFGNFYSISSEVGLAIWLNGREQRKPVTIKEVPVEKILTISLENLTGPFEEVDFDAYTTYSYVNKWKTPTWGAPVNTPATNSRVVSNLPVPTNKFKIGDIITMKVADLNDRDGVPVILGHPVFEDDTMDENIVVRVFIPPQEDQLKFIERDFWTVRINGIRPYGGHPIIYAGDPKPVEIYRDIAGNTIRSDQLIVNAADPHLLVQGCNKCTGVINLAFVGKSLIQRKKNGKLRVICHECMEQINKTEPKERGNLVSVH